jgi:hypothetical protein
MNVSIGAGTAAARLYPPEQVLEKIRALPEWNPVRLFGVLFPIWDVDAVGLQGEEQAYPFFEKIIERGIAQAGLTSEAALADFLGLELDLIERVLISLETAGSLVRIDGQFHLTPQAMKSVHEGKKYVPVETPMKLYFEGYYSKPLTNAHYDGVAMLSQVEAEDFVQERRGTNCPFYRLYSFRRWSPLAIKELALREDRIAFHVSEDIQQLSLVRVTPAYLPMYIVDVRKPSIPSTPYYMVFSAIQGGRDQYLEQMVNSYAEILLPLSAKEKRDLASVWETWLREQGITDARTELLENGHWRATIPAEELRSPVCKLAVSELDTYHMEQGYFLHLWCQNELLRCQAALDQTLQALQKLTAPVSLSDVQQLLLLYTSIDHLQTPPLVIADLLVRAEELGMSDQVELLTRLIKEPEQTDDTAEKKADESGDVDKK